MVKQSKKTLKLQRKTPINYPISKRKTILQNLTNFKKMLLTQHSTIGWSTYLSYLHHYIRRCHGRLKSCDLIEARDIVQICAACDGWHPPMLTCSSCEDNFHPDCYAQQQPNSNQNCPRCDKYDSYLAHFAEERCEGCGEEGKLIKCMKCALPYHKQCFGMYGAVCTLCYVQVEREVQEQTQKNTVENEAKEQESTRLTRVNIPQNYIVPQPTSESIHQSISETIPQLDEQTRKIVKQKSRFEHLFPQLSKEQLQEYRKELFYAICCKKMRYNPNLVPLQCVLKARTQHTLDFGLQQMTAPESRVYEAYKRQPIGPFHLTYTEDFGFDVVAGCDLAKGTLVCEYVGEVICMRRAREREQKGHNDSIMELQARRNADETLVIYPEQYTNIARFINGASRQEQINVESVRRMSPHGPVVLLYTCKHVKKGASLFYQYNGEMTNTYNTSGFK